MVSVGDTDISLHICPGCVCGGGGGGGGILGKLKTQKPLSVKICLNFNGGGGGGILGKSQLKNL